MNAMSFDMLTDNPGAMLKQVLTDGWRLWMRKPWQLAGLSLSPVLVELLVQPVPVIGMVASKILAFFLVGVIWIAFDDIARDARIDVGRITTMARHNASAWAVLTLVSVVVVFGFQVLTGWAIFGPRALEWLVLGDFETHPSENPMLLLAVIPAGVVPGTLLMLAMPLSLLRGMPATAALLEGVRIVFRHPGFFALYALVSAAIVLAAVLTLLGLLLVLPWLAASGYAIYRRLVPEEARPVAM